MKWTKEQLSAIENRNKNIMLSASAGSGKTAVLVERVIRLIIEDGVDVNRMLIVTFTKAAATEMKLKIAEAIKKRLKSEKNIETAVLFKEQLELLAQASISTFHSFAMSIIKKYFYKIDISPNVRVSDEVFSNLLKDKAIDETFEQFYQDEDEDFFKFIDMYGNDRSDYMLKQSILASYNKLRTIPNFKEWLTDSIDAMQASDAEMMKQAFFEALAEVMSYKTEKIVSDLKRIINFGNVSGIKKPTKQLEEKFQDLSSLIAKSKDEIVVELLKNKEVFKFERLSSTKEDKKNIEDFEDFKKKRSKLKEFSEKFKNEYLDATIEEQFELIREAGTYAECYKKIVYRLDEIYAEKKRDKGLIDYEDIEHYCIEVLKDDDVRRDCREKYAHIFVDEYQDSNYLQEKIIEMIKRESNLFTVGDIKQSIYRFRMARPEIFERRRNNYAESEADNSINIMLNENFRSKKGVLNAVNCIFDNLIDNYSQERLKCGISYDSKYEKKARFHLVKQSVAEGDDKAKNKANSKKRHQLQAQKAVDIIKNIVGKEFYDHKTDRIRKYEYSDCVILLRNRQPIDTYKKKLEENLIPVLTYDEENYFKKIEIIQLVDILKVIDNSLDEIALLSSLRSPFLKFNIDEITAIRLSRTRGSYREAFMSIANSTDPIEYVDEELQKKVKNTIEKIRSWKKRAQYIKLQDFVWEIMMESNFYTYVCGLPNGEKRKNNIRIFLDEIESYTDRGDNSISGFLDFIDRVDDMQTIGAQKNAGSKQAVRIMTIHASKGLEFPVVIVPGLERKIDRSQGNTDIIYFQNDIGIGMHLINSRLKYKVITWPERVIKDIELRENYNEELRILYVAFTRAQDSLYLLTDYEKSDQGFTAILLDDETVLNLDENFKISRNESIDIIGEEAENDRFSSRSVGEYLKLYTGDAEEGKKDIEFILKYRYPQLNQLKRKAKYGVTELIRDENSPIKQAEIKQIFTPTAEKTPQKAMQLGSIYHKILEMLDYSVPAAISKSDVELLVDELIEKKLIEKEYLNDIDVDKIMKFLEWPVLNAVDERSFYKERPFVMWSKLEQHADDEGKEEVEVLTQGIIDCYFYNKEGDIVLIDYKTDSNVIDIGIRYENQLKLYAEAIEKATGKKVAQGWIYSFAANDGFRVI